MYEYLSHILDKISFSHLNILLLLGLALFGGSIGGRIFQKLRIPQVVGYIIIGILIGQSGLKIVGHETIKALEPLNYFTLGLIGFIVGGELKKEVFLKYGKQLISILLWEGITPFILVFLFTGLAGTFLFGHTPFVWALAILLGAIASATDPATTSSVLKEYKSKGPLTATILGIIALDDALALLLFAIASSTALVLIGYVGEGLLTIIIHPFYEIGGAVLLGVISGLILNKILKRYTEKEKILAFSIGTVLFVTGLSLAAGLSMLLALMTLGIVVTNTLSHKSKEVFAAIEAFAPPIFVLFFVMVGAKLKFSHMTYPVLFLVAVYLVSGLGGKMIGAKIGARLSRAPQVVSKYLPFSLFSQAGIAIGLSILAAQHFPENIGNTLVIIITGTTFVTQLLGPPLTKFAIIRSGESGLNITEEDILERSKAQDLMELHPPLIYENMQLGDILKIFSESENLYYPVVDSQKRLRGIITLEGIKQTFLDKDIRSILLAHDMMEPVKASVSASTPMKEVSNIMDENGLEYMPVVKEDKIIDGFVEKRNLHKSISTKIIELHKQADSIN